MSEATTNTEMDYAIELLIEFGELYTESQNRGGRHSQTLEDRAALLLESLTGQEPTPAQVDEVLPNDTTIVVQ